MTNKQEASKVVTTDMLEKILKGFTDSLLARKEDVPQWLSKANAKMAAGTKTTAREQSESPEAVAEAKSALGRKGKVKGLVPAEFVPKYIAWARAANEPWIDSYGVHREASKGVSTRTSGLTEAIKSEYGLTSRFVAMALINALAGTGTIALSYRKGDVRVYLPNEAPAQARVSGETLVAKMAKGLPFKTGKAK